MDPVQAGRTGPRHAGRPRGNPIVAAVVVGLLAACAAAGPALARTAWPGPDRPGLPVDAAPAPLARPAQAPAGSGGYAVLHTQDDGSGRPVRWDPCRPIHYVVRDDGAPPGAADALAAALGRIQELTGLRFVADGPSTEVPVPRRALIQPERYGRRWVPVLVAWTDPAQYPPIAGYAGLAGGDPVSGSGPGSKRYVSGVVLLNREHLRTVAGWPDGQDRMRAVILHELAHLVGLDHVEDPQQLMHARPTTLTRDLAAGDRRGLAALAGGPCFRDF